MDTLGGSQIQTEGFMGKARPGGTIETNNLGGAYRRINLIPIYNRIKLSIF